MDMTGFGFERDRPRLILGSIVLMLALATMLVSAASASAVGSISGTVIDSVTEEPIDDVEVCAQTEEELSFEDCTFTSSSGQYTLSELAADEYAVEFWAPYLGYRTQYYDGKATFAEADLVAVTTGTVTGIDAELEEIPGSIGGTVTDAASSAPIAGVEVCAYEVVEEFFRCTETGAGGAYSILALDAGEYIVEFWAQHLGYAVQYYNGSASFEGADLVAVAESSVTGINAALVKPSPPPVPVIAPPPLPAPPPFAPKGKAKAKGKKCKKGFRRKKVRGKKRCVRVKKGKRKGQRRRR
jgi:hypothetical protein